MFDTATSALAGVAAAVDQLLATAAGTAFADPGAGVARGLRAPAFPASPAELLVGLEQLQQIVNLATTVEQRLLAHAIDADAFEALGAASPADLLVHRLHLRRSEAHARVRRAKAAAPRTTLTGEVLPPKLEVLAAAQSEGAVSGDHVDVVTQWLTRIEPHASLTQFAEAERALVARAGSAPPDAVADLGRETLDRLNPDGPGPRDLERRRCVSVRQADDGAGKLTGTLTPEVLAKLQTLLSPLAAPRPLDESGIRDARGVGHREHDAFEELLDRLLQSEGMPSHGGIPLTLVVMLDIDDLLARTGTARTAFGTTIPVARLLEQAAEMQVVPVILSKVDGILAYGRERRIASNGQALALIARDRGCTFPGCSRPAVWCQRHHIKEVVADNGDTDLDNLVLVCAHHHRNFGRWGWSVHLEGGRAWWTPPACVDPNRQPIRNEAHHPPDARPASLPFL